MTAAIVSGRDRVLGVVEPAWRWVRRALVILYVAGTYVYLQHRGDIPTDREILAGWLVGACLLVTVGRRRRDALLVVAAWLPFIAALWAYDYARSIGFQLNRPVIVTPQLAVDRFLGFGQTPTTRLQNALFEPHHIRWYDVMVSVVYQSHFIVPYLAAGAFWRNRRLWRTYTASFVAVTFSACAVFAVFATAAPWYAASKGLLPWYATAQPGKSWPRYLVGRGWGRIHLSFAARIIEKGQGAVNPFAAIPSLHSAEALLVVAMVLPFLRGRWRWARPLLLLYPLAMCFTLVYAGEHYLIDVLVGWGFVATVLTVGWWIRQRRGWASPWAVASLDSRSADGDSSADGPGGDLDRQHAHEIDVGLDMGDRTDMGDRADMGDRTGVGDRRP